MKNARTTAGIEKAQADGVKFGRTLGSKNKNTEDKIEKIKIFLQAKRSYDWISKELKVRKQTVSKIKNTIPKIRN